MGIGPWQKRKIAQEDSIVAFAYQQTSTLVNIKLKWVKDRVLDEVVARERDLKPVCHLVSIISSASNHCLPIYHLSRHRRQLGLPEELKLATLLRRYPSLFHEYTVNSKGGTVPWFELTDEAIRLRREECRVARENENLGLPYDYDNSLVPLQSQIFSLVTLHDERIGLKLLVWDDSLAISHLEKNAIGGEPLSFPIGFTRGFGLKKKCMLWLDEWQRLPYTSPYANASHLDSRTDVSEKRIVGVFHELLNLMIHKKTERKNMSNLRKRLGLPQKFTKVFGRHPGIFYISQKCSTHTIILREAYDRHELRNKHPLVGIREKYARVMKIGFQYRSMGLYKRLTIADGDQDDGEHKEDKSDQDIRSARSTYDSDLEFLLEEDME
ncbi:hypothetical protein ACHQM5_018488 [Ranunculus cassubicifolius]